MQNAPRELEMSLSFRGIFIGNHKFMPRAGAIN